MLMVPRTYTFDVLVVTIILPLLSRNTSPLEKNDLIRRHIVEKSLPIVWLSLPFPQVVTLISMNMVAFTSPIKSKNPVDVFAATQKFPPEMKSKER